jgi:hypothetical protein
LELWKKQGKLFIEERTGDIPDYPQGTVIRDCFGTDQISIPISEA